MQEDQKQRLLDNSERLERTSKHLQEGYRIAVETEQIGAQVLSNLAQQRESIQKSRNRVSFERRLRFSRFYKLIKILIAARNGRRIRQIVSTHEYDDS